LCNDHEQQKEQFDLRASYFYPLLSFVRKEYYREQQQQKFPIDNICINMYNISKRFEWDHKKAESNRLKHGVTFDEAQLVFDDPYAISFEDIEHSTIEERFRMVGMATIGLLVVTFTYRHDLVRIISAREASPYMRRIYAGKSR
jgi:uncharacterized DUF497 family protein